MISRKIIIIILMCLLPQFIFSLVEKEFTVSFSPIIMKNMDSKYIHLANSLPMLLYSELQYSNFHQYSYKEILSIKEKNLDFLKIEYLNVLSKLKEKYDKYFFSNNFNRNEYDLIKKDIEKQKLLIENLNILSIENISPSVPIKFLINSDGNITDDNPDSEISDMVIKGSLEKLDEWIYIQFWLENKILNTDELIYKSVSSTDNLVDLIPEISASLKTIILGREWSSLEFDLDPKDSNIIVKDNMGKIVEEEFGYLYPGIYNIEISKPGYKLEQIQVELEDFEALIIDLKLEMEKKSIISLQSFPAGADLYSGSTWIGKTPVLIKSPLIPTLLTIKHEGYNDSRYIYNERSGRDIQIFMESSLIDRDKIIRNKRNVFYKSFSYFLLSIPMSMISFGVSSDYAYACDREVYYSSEIERLKQLSNAWYYVYLGSMFINITLFVNTIFDLVDYIKSSDFL